MSSKKIELLKSLVSSGCLSVGELSAYSLSEIQDTYCFSCSDYRIVENWNGKVTDNLIFLPNYCSGSDYSGCAVELSNFESLKSAWEGKAWMKEYSGGHGTFGIFIHVLEFIRDHEEEGESLDYLSGLGNYPVIDEEELWKIESQWEEDAWQDWCSSDFESELRKAFPELLSDEIDIDGEELRKCFEKAREEANEYWVHESIGTGAYIHLEKIVSAVSERDIKILIGDTEDLRIPSVDQISLPFTD